MEADESSRDLAAGTSWDVTSIPSTSWDLRDWDF